MFKYEAKMLLDLPPPSTVTMEFYGPVHIPNTEVYLGDYTYKVIGITGERGGFSGDKTTVHLELVNEVTRAPPILHK